MGMSDQIDHSAYMDGGQIGGRFIIFGSVEFFIYMNQGEGMENMLDVIWMKVGRKMD